METFKINVKEIDLEIPRDKVQELVKYLEMDEIVDSMRDKKQIDSLIDRLCMDHPENISKLLNDFFKSKHEDEWQLLNENQQEQLESQYYDYLSKRYKL